MRCMTEANPPLQTPHTPQPHIVTVGRHRIARVLERVAEGFQSQARITHLSASFDSAVDAVRALHARTPVDALVVAGASGAWIRERVDIPVAMVEVRGVDLLGALARARALSPPKMTVALVAFGAVSQQVAQFDAQFGAGIAQFSYHGPEDAAACVQVLQAAGIGAVGAPGLVADLAQEAGIASVLLYSDTAVQQAFSEALLLARQRLGERTRHQRLQTILGQLQDGVVAVDCQQRIEALNPAMAALLGLPAQQLQGRVLAAVAPQLDMAHTLQYLDGSEDVVQLATRTQVVRRAPIVENGVLTGALLVCRDPHTIHSAERHLRANQRQRQREQGVGGVRWSIDDYAGDSAAVQRLRTLALQCAASDATVLIGGESGTGKELLAQGIHRASGRAQQPFLAVNCAALSESLLESELFGYEEGAFTGARRGGKTGLIEAAHTGTLFLDEIGDMPLALQSRLLRVLQEREVLRVGSTTPVPVDVRVIAATHADLGAQVGKGLFRRDLYYRLAVLRLATPALRDRTPSDVAQLAQALLQRRLKAAGDPPVDVSTLLAAMLQRAQGHTWPGNVRELENWVERLLACQGYVCNAPGVVDTARLLEVFPECAEPLGAPVDPQPPAPLKDTRHRAEQQRVREVLDSVQGDQRQACEILGISRATLWRRMKS